MILQSSVFSVKVRIVAGQIMSGMNILKDLVYHHIFQTLNIELIHRKIVVFIIHGLFLCVTGRTADENNSACNGFLCKGIVCK